MLAVAGVLLVSLGVGLWSVPAGFVVAGVECIAAAYVITYLRAAKAR
jgi:hypothetical protein